MKEYDVVIAGGAMTGATLALALENDSNKRLSIAVIEPYKVEDEAHPGFDSRAIALSYGTKRLLESFQLWRDIEPLVTPIDHIHVSDKGHAGMTDIDKDDEDMPALGYVVELAELGVVYNQRLACSHSIDFICPDSVASITRMQEKHQISLASGKTLLCKLLVAADGADSTCCQLLGHHSHAHDFEQTAVITNVQVSKPHEGQAFERFTSNGPLALLPMSQNRMSVVWCMTPEDAEQVMALSDEQFIENLQNKFGWRLGKITKTGQRASYPLILKRQEQLVSHRFVAVGNAAQLLHPIAGQGFNLGIRDIASLVESILSCDKISDDSSVAHRDDVGDYSVLSGYRQRRENDRAQTINLTAGMVHVFSNEWFPLQLGRNLGLIFMDNMPLLKAPLLKRTIGLVRR